MFVVVNIEHSDEIFQTLEQAYRLVFGWGFIPWEFELGLKSWIFPGLLAAIISITEQLAPGSQAFLPAIGGFMAAASLSIVACAFLWGYRLSGLTGAIIVGTLAAAWGDLVYFAPRTLTEVMAANVFVVGVYLAYVERSRTSRARFLAAGAMFGLAFILRIHLGPAIALAALWTAVPDWRRRLPWMVLGGLAPVLLSGLVDALTWGRPFQSIWLNFTLNVVDDVGSTFTRQSWDFYANKLAGRWGGAVPILAATALLGVGRMPLLGAIAAAIVLSHTAIAHKEVRFIYRPFRF